MSAKLVISVAVVAAVAGLAESTVRASITIPTVAVGDPGNAADPTTGFGSVAYSYNIGTTEVTVAQYAAFLNAVAATDTYGLYNTNMSGSLTGITRSGSSGSYTYAVNSGRGNFPVNYVSFWDATRFANWLHNGQPTGGQNASTTEAGAYTLTSAGITNNTVTRNAGWQWAVADANEWHKAAYYQPASAGGPSSSYWPWPTSSNDDPTFEGAFLYRAPTGNIAEVGTYAANYSGTFDMAGNLGEWSEYILGASLRGIRSGYWHDRAFPWSHATANYGDSPIAEGEYLGFRLVAIPGPSSVALLAIGGLAAGRRRSR